MTRADHRTRFAVPARNSFSSVSDNQPRGGGAGRYRDVQRSRSTSELPGDELAASLAARRELGPDYDAAFVEAVAERIERAMALTVIGVSLGVSIPTSAIAADQAGPAGLTVVRVALVLINVAFAPRPRRRWAPARRRRSRRRGVP